MTVFNPMPMMRRFLTQTKMRLGHHTDASIFTHSEYSVDIIPCRGSLSQWAFDLGFYPLLTVKAIPKNRHFGIQHATHLTTYRADNADSPSIQRSARFVHWSATRRTNQSSHPGYAIGFCHYPSAGEA